VDNKHKPLTEKDINKCKCVLGHTTLEVKDVLSALALLREYLKKYEHILPTTIEDIKKDIDECFPIGVERMKSPKGVVVDNSPKFPLRARVRYCYKQDKKIKCSRFSCGDCSEPNEYEKKGHGGGCCG
jgi:hypothetical protein